MHQIRIDSLENVMKRRSEAQLKAPVNEESVAMIRDLERQNKKWQERLSKMEKRHADQLREQQDKANEMQKILEQNGQTLKERCEVLQMQIEHVKREKLQESQRS